MEKVSRIKNSNGSQHSIPENSIYQAIKQAVAIEATKKTKNSTETIAKQARSGGVTPWWT